MVIASIISIIITTNNLSPPNDALEKCNELKFNSADAVNILCFSTKEQAKEYSDFFLQVQPFDENKEAAQKGGRIASNTRKELEQETKKSVVSKNNFLGLTQKKKIKDDKNVK